MQRPERTDRQRLEAIFEAYMHDAAWNAMRMAPELLAAIWTARDEVETEKRGARDNHDHGG